MNYGFVMDNRKCIGCHACSTACKSENDVPLGVARTWVKYTETGQYPDARRNFQVTRCNHCENPPCVRICPVTAMYQRDDGIVEFDPDVCIGCKACMQACPYDAIYIDPNNNTAAKCHYCAHRVDVGLEPACVVVCPTHAIISGDMDDPESEISRTLAKHNVMVRKPEQGTAPKTFYIEGSASALVPTAATQTPETFIWADVVTEQGLHGDAHGSTSDVSKKSASGTPIRTPKAQGAPTGGAIKHSGKPAEQMVQVVYNQQHKVPWHWQVPAYIVTKDIAAGIMMLFAIFFGFGQFAFDKSVAVGGGLISIFFTLVTTLFLIMDLERPERFLRIVFRPQFKSWLVRGAFLLITFSNITGIWWVLEVAGSWEILPASLVESVRNPLLIINLPFALGAAIYTAFLFAQAEGRDLWQSPLLPVQMFLRSIYAGAGGILLLNLFVAVPADMMNVTTNIFIAGLIADLLVTFFGEFGISQPSEVAARAAHEISHGKYKGSFWGGYVVLGHIVPVALVLVADLPIVGAIAFVASMIGLYLMENAFVMAPQEVPNS